MVRALDCGSGCRGFESHHSPQLVHQEKELLTTQPYKGSRDFYPSDKRVQKWMFSKLRETCEQFGYTEYDAPILEPTDLYRAKGNDEIVNQQTYSFIDRGGRDVTIRTEMTPTVSRMVAAKRNELGYPLRWYSIPNLWRYERPQRGRLREFWQLNVDIFGAKEIYADFEIIQVASSTLINFGAKQTMFTVNVNDRKLTDYILGTYCNLEPDTASFVMRLTDRKDKMPIESYRLQLKEIIPSTEIADKLIEVFECKNINDLPDSIKNSDAISDTRKLLEMLNASGFKNVVFNPALMRGFDYYTGLVFEINDNDSNNNRAMFGGGRYDGLVGNFGVEPVPTAGFGMGDVTLFNFLQSHNLLEDLISEINLAILFVGDLYVNALDLVESIRNQGINVSIDFTDRKIEKKIKAVAKDGIKHVLIIGQDEISEGKYSLKNLDTRQEEVVPLEDIREKITVI